MHEGRDRASESHVSAAPASALTGGARAAFFDPRSVAVIGASRDPSKVGGSVVANLRAAGFQGRIVPVNAQADAVQGLPAFPSLLAVNGSVDLAVIAVPAPSVLSALKECVAKDVGGAVVISAGFGEAGRDGRMREAELRAWLRDQPIRVLGPNCLGWIRPSRRLNVTFAPGLPPAGGIAFISHSGALATAILDWARERRLGFSLFASLGNQVDLTEADWLAAVSQDPETRVIAGYVEGVADGRRFFTALRAAAAVKPVVILKAGRSPEGARAVISHTGALAGSDQAFDAAVKQSGAVRARTVEELFDLARALGSQPLPRGRRILVLTNGGGLGIVATDAARDAGLEIPTLDGVMQQRLRAVLPSTASVANPVDLVGDADAARYGNALHALAAADVADAALVMLTAQASTDALAVARAVLGAMRDWTIPIAAAFVGGGRVAAGVRTLEEGGIPCYTFPEPAVITLAGMATVAERRQPVAEWTAVTRPPAAVEQLARLRRAGATRLGFLEVAPLLRSYGIETATAELAADAAGARAVAQRLGVPVALKIVSPELSHKTEVAGVVLGLRSPSEVADAAADMLTRLRAERPQAMIRGLIVQPMLPAGKELLLGVVSDPQFGPLVVVGFGGVYVEVLKDTATRLAPVTPREALAMLDELRMAPLLRGVRGEPAVNRAAVADAVSRLARLAVDCPEVAEIELNPLIATAEGAVAVDARATLEPGGSDGDPEESRQA